MEAKEKQQHAEDKEFIERYYNQQPSKRKRYNENKKERLWRAEERLAMSAEDINIQGFNNTVDQKFKKKTMSLSSSLLALAKTLDKKVDNSQQVHQTAHGNTKWIEPGVSATAAASGFKPKPLLNVRMELSRPFFPIGEHSAPLHRSPEQMIDKCYPKARTCHHSRHLPQLDNQQHWSWQWVEPRPPYGIQLLEEFRRWKANQ